MSKVTNEGQHCLNERWLMADGVMGVSIKHKLKIPVDILMIEGSHGHGNVLNSGGLLNRDYTYTPRSTSGVP